MNSNSRKVLITSFYVLLLLFFVIFFKHLYSFYSFINKPPSSVIETRKVQIKAGTDLNSIARQLFKNGIISSSSKFKLYVRLKGVSGKLKAGEYHFTTFMSPCDVLKRLLKGETILKKLTVPEGLTINQVAKLMAKHKLGNYKKILTTMKDKNFLKKIGIDAPTLEGYLFPDTYCYSSSQSYKDLIAIMVKQFKKHFGEIWENRSPDNPLSKYEVLILASMVEKEAMVDSERPIIAGVFINRLKRGMLLQCDPTVIYGIENFNGNLTKKDLNTKTPYNTYLIKGLPPGPICNPGLASLKAAANPANVKYLFFVSMNNGHHFFSETIRDHINAVRKYQLKKHRKIKHSK